MRQPDSSPARRPSTGTVFLAGRTGARRIEQRIRTHADLVAVLVVVVAFGFMVAEARSRYFTPDEALHFELVNLPRFLDVYRSSHSNAHPPLFFLILRFWLTLGQSESFLRLLPAICGGGFLWFAYRWAGRLLGKSAGLMALLIAALSPACLPLSAEVRGYSLFLLLSVAALSEFEHAVETRSAPRMVLFSLLLYLAILTHYSALFLTVSLGVYALFRLRESRVPRKVVAVWAAFQAGGVILYLFLYVSHVAILRGSALERGVKEVWIRNGYFNRGRGMPLAFVVHQTEAMFRYFFGSPLAAAVAFLLAVAGVVLLAVRRRISAVLLVLLPFVLGATAGLLGLYPFSESRHTIYLVPFLAAAIGVALSALTAGRFWPTLLATAGVAVLFWREPVWMAPPQSLTGMNVAMDRVRAAIVPGSLVFADSRMGALLGYYLGRGEFSTVRTVLEPFWESDTGHYCIVVSRIWDPDARTFVDEIERMIKVYRVPAGQPFWVTHLGLPADPTRELFRRFDGGVIPARFGEVLLFEVWPQEESDAAASRPAGSDHASTVISKSGKSATISNLANRS
jgi:hypothetical protein